MSQTSYLKRLASRCNHLAGEISDSDGFVSVQRLVERFGATLLIRPLLVEGMLASIEQTPNGKCSQSKHGWCLLLDRETHDVNEREIASERFGTPLPVRLRNTVAHELAHSLSFRPTEFGVQFPRQFDSEKTKHEFVKSIERETEKLSPLLLLTDAMLDRLFSPYKERVFAQELREAMRSAGASRYVFVNRLNLLDLADAKRLKLRRCMEGLAVGIGEWLSEQDARFKVWPLFHNFEGGKVPGFLFQLQRGIPLAVKTIFSDPAFHLCGGSSNITECMVAAGTPRNPSVFKLPICCSVEEGPRTAGSEFLFAIQSLKRPD